MWGIQVIFPTKLSHNLLEELHQDHPEATRMKSIAQTYMWWPGLNKELEDPVKICQRMPISEKRIACSTTTSLCLASKAMATSSFGLRRSLPECNASSSRGCLFWMGRNENHDDHHSSKDTGCVARAVSASLSRWLVIMVDNSLLRNLQPSPRWTESVTPKVHLTIQPRMAWQSIQMLKESLKGSRYDGCFRSQKIPLFLHTYQTTTGVPPCQLLMQHNLSIHFTFPQPDLESHVSAKQAQHKVAHDQWSHSRHWQVGDHVIEGFPSRTWLDAGLKCLGLWRNWWKSQMVRPGSTIHIR